MNEALGVALYKYLNYDGARKTLENCTVKLSSPLVFNDPFDMQLVEAFGLDITEFIETLGPALFNFLSSDIDCSQIRQNHLTDKLIRLNQSWRNGSKAKLDAIKAEILSRPLTDLYDFNVLRQENQFFVDKLQNDFRGSGFFAHQRTRTAC